MTPTEIMKLVSDAVTLAAAAARDTARGTKAAVAANRGVKSIEDACSDAVYAETKAAIALSMVKDALEAIKVAEATIWHKATRAAADAVADAAYAEAEVIAYEAANKVAEAAV